MKLERPSIKEALAEARELLENECPVTIEPRRRTAKGAVRYIITTPTKAKP
jgi:hypothetical protein